MTLRNFPPADQCEPDDLDAIADLVVRDPSASWDLAGSREHIEALCRRYQDLVQALDMANQDRDAWQRRALDAAEERDAARAEIRALQSTLDAERNERQGEVLQAEADRERADEAEVRAEQMRHQLEAMAALLDEQRQTRDLDDQLRSTCRTIAGKDLGEVDIQLDEELAANPDAGPLHHARDQREQEDAP